MCGYVLFTAAPAATAANAREREREERIVWVGVGRGTLDGWISGLTRSTGTLDGHLKDCVTSSSSSETRQGRKEPKQVLRRVETNPYLNHVTKDVDLATFKPFIVNLCVMKLFQIIEKLSYFDFLDWLEIILN